MLGGFGTFILFTVFSDCWCWLICQFRLYTNDGLLSPAGKRRLTSSGSSSSSSSSSSSASPDSSSASPSASLSSLSSLSSPSVSACFSSACALYISLVPHLNKSDQVVIDLHPELVVEVANFIGKHAPSFALTYVGIKNDTKEEKKEGLEDSESCALSWFDIVWCWCRRVERV
jgi:hypothetical protein